MRNIILVIILHLIVGNYCIAVAQRNISEVENVISVERTELVVLSKDKELTTLKCQISGFPIISIINENAPVTITRDFAYFLLETDVVHFGCIGEGILQTKEEIKVGDEINLDCFGIGNHFITCVKAKVVKKQKYPLSINSKIFVDKAQVEVMQNLLKIKYSIYKEKERIPELPKVIKDSLSREIADFPANVNKMFLFAPQLDQAETSEILNLYNEIEGKVEENKFNLTSYRLKKEKIDIEAIKHPYIEAKYPGDWIQYLQSHLKYPAIAIKQEVQGSVKIEFVVGKDGSISQMKVLKSLSKECDAEAMRVIRSAKWTPAKDEQGNLVSSIKVQEIYFVLQ